MKGSVPDYLQVSHALDVIERAGRLFKADKVAARYGHADPDDLARAQIHGFLLSP